MENRLVVKCSRIVLFLFFGFPPSLQAQSLWATTYYAGWQQGWANNGHLPAQAVDYSAMTHIVHFSLVPNFDGTIDPDANSITQTNSTELLTRAHAAGRKVLICVGGAGSDGGFRGAASVANRATFIANLVAFMTTRGYDGIDIDWEPLYPTDAVQYTALIAGLRTALNALTPRPLLTAAVAWEGGILAQVHQHFDQINIMTYDLSGPWEGWVTWHNAPIYDGGFVFPSTGNPVPSINRMVDGFIAAGVPASKLGIGIDFYGYIWSGGDGTSTGGVATPRQSWTVTPSRSFETPYYSIMQNYYQASFYRWDAAAQAAYLQIDNAGSANDKFISYDNETTVQKKFDYARSKGIGGLIVWELGGGYRPEQPTGQRDPLLQAVKTALGGTSSAGGGDPTIPSRFFLGQNYPNPFNPTTEIEFRIPFQAHVALRIYNLLGEEISTLVNKEMHAGSYSYAWTGSSFASGTYIYSLKARIATGEEFIQTRKLVLLK